MLCIIALQPLLRGRKAHTYAWHSNSSKCNAFTVVCFDSSCVSTTFSSLFHINMPGNTAVECCVWLFY